MHDRKTGNDTRVSKARTLAVSKHVDQEAGDRNAKQETDVSSSTKPPHADESTVKSIEQRE